MMHVWLMLAIAFFAYDASASTFYVDVSHPQADDNLEGSIQQPFRTIGRGIRALRPGDRLVVRRGIYRENIEISTSGTREAPIVISGEPGAVIRGTRGALSNFQKLEGQASVYFTVVTDFLPGRVVETNESRWKPLPVQDPNGVRFEFVRPVLYQGVTSVSEVSQVPGSYWLDPASKRLYLRTFDGGDPRKEPYGLEAGRDSDGIFGIRASHVVVSSLAFEYAKIVQFFNATMSRMESLDLLATPLQVRSSSGCVIDGVKVENHIARGNTHEWHHRGSGTGVSITEDSTNTVLRNLLVVRGWNGVGFGGIGTMADNVQIWGFPNHGAGMSGRNNVLSRLRIWNVQDSVWMQDGQNITIQNSHMMEPIHIRVGSSAVKLRNNVIFGGQVYVLEDSKTGFDSDYNLFVTTTWDYRIGSTRANSLDETQRLHGRELHSLTAADTTAVFEGWEGRAALNSVLPLSESSPAIDRGDPAYPVPTGGGTRIDIGPFERGAANDVPGVRVAPQVPPPPGSLGIRR